MYKCEGCGFEAKSKAGLLAHKRHCSVKSKDAVKAPEEPQPDGLVTVNLKHTITINGHRYGGVHTVPASLAQDLNYRDGQITRREEKEKQSVGHNTYLGDLRG